jgi:uncharacterized membrane protein YhaH (DUF805 family)
MAMKKYVTFSGRARRSEYWYFILPNFLILICAIVGEYFLNTGLHSTPFGLFFIIYAFVIILPCITLSIRRLHDVGKSGWFLVIALIPVIGVIWLFVYMFKDSDTGSNQYGVNPKSSTNNIRLIRLVPKVWD